MEREADEFVDFRESARFRAFPAGDSELRKWTVSRSAAKLPLQHEEAEDLQTTPQTHSGLEDQDSPTDLRQEEPTVVVEAAVEAAVEVVVEEVEEEDSRWQQEIRTMAPS